MKKWLVIILCTAFIFGCSSDDIGNNDLLPNITVNETLFLNNPEFINLQVIGGWAYARGGIAGIIVYRTGSNHFIAFERSAPHIKPSSCSKMTVENGIIMNCACDDAQFSILDGSPMTEGVKYSARQYRAFLSSDNTLQITNF